MVVSAFERKNPLFAVNLHLGQLDRLLSYMSMVPFPTSIHLMKLGRNLLKAKGRVPVEIPWHFVQYWEQLQFPVTVRSAEAR